MAKDFKLHTGDEIVILTLNGSDYIAKANDSEGPFLLNPPTKEVEPKVELWSVESDCGCEIDTDYYITDANGVVFYPIVGPRPKNIFKRKRA